MSTERISPKSSHPDSGNQFLIESLPEPYTPEDVLRRVAEYSGLSSNELAEFMTPSAFDGMYMKIDEQERLVLLRYAHDQSHLLKAEKEATIEAMQTSVYTPTSPDNGVVHTSAALNWGIISSWLHDSGYKIYGIFKIPLSDLLELTKQKKVCAGQAAEAEVVLSGDVAARYLTETYPISDMQPIFALIEPEKTDTTP